jgi:hypothetical protein
MWTVESYFLSAMSYGYATKGVMYLVTFDFLFTALYYSISMQLKAPLAFFAAFIISGIHYPPSKACINSSWKGWLMHHILGSSLPATLEGNANINQE